MKSSIYPLLVFFVVQWFLLSAQAQTTQVQFIASETGAGIAGVVVTSASAPFVAGTHAVMMQQNREFVPHALVVAQGTRVDFPNLDTVQHHVYSFSKPKPLNIELYAGKPEAPIEFDQSGVVELGCNIHDQMQGFILVIPNQEWRLTDAQGYVGLDSRWLESGALQVWHPRLRDNSQMLRVSVSQLTQPVPLDVEPETDQPAGGLNDLQKRFRNLR